MELIKAKNEDLDSIIIIFKENIKLMNKHGLTFWNNSWNKKIITKIIKNKNIFIIKNNKINIGTITLDKNQPNYYENSIKNIWSNPNSENVMYISGFAILPNYQRKGFGSIILKKIEMLMKKSNIKYIRFDLNIKNKKIEKFYFKNKYILKGKYKESIFFEKKI